MFDGFWYVFAMDKKVFKKFHLKSIKELEILSEYSFIPSDIESKIKRAKSAWFNLADSFTVRLWVSYEIAKYFDRKPLNNNEMIIDNRDKSNLEQILVLANGLNIQEANYLIKQLNKAKIKIEKEGKNE